MQQVEGIEDDLVTRMGTPMLERLERWTPLGVQRDDLAVDYRLVGLQPLARRRDPRIHRCEVLVLPRSNPVCSLPYRVAGDLLRVTTIVHKMQLD